MKASRLIRCLLAALLFLPLLHAGDTRDHALLRAEEQKLISTPPASALQKEYLLFYLRMAYADKLKTEGFTSAAFTAFLYAQKTLNLIRETDAHWHPKLIAAREADMTVEQKNLGRQMPDLPPPLDQVFEEFIAIDINFYAPDEPFTQGWNQTADTILAPDAKTTQADYMKAHPARLQPYQQFQAAHPQWQPALLKSRIAALSKS